MLVPIDSLTVEGINKLTAKGYVVEIQADEQYASIHKEKSSDEAVRTQEAI